MHSAKKPTFSLLLALALGLLTMTALIGCDFYAPKKGGQPQSQSEPKKDASDGPEAEAGLEEGAPPAPEPPGPGAPSAPAASGSSGAGAKPNPEASSSGGASSPSPAGEVAPPPAPSGESTAPSEGSGQGSTPPKNP